MKRSTITLLIILSVIALLHFMFLYVFMWSGTTEDKKTEPVPELIPEPTVIMPDGKTYAPKKPVRAAPSATPAPVLPSRSTASSKPSTHLDYSKTVYSTRLFPGLKYVKYGILYDPSTNKVLWARNAKKSVVIASMSKMMTLLLALEKLKANPKLNMNTIVKVTPSSTRVSPTIAGLKPGETISMELLLKSMIIKSANDSAELTAEVFGNGNAGNFISAMNRRAIELGMTKTSFSNPHGLPTRNGDDNRASCEDLIILANKLLKHPEARKWVATKYMDFRKNSKGQMLRFKNHNHLLENKSCPGVNGIKTGYTRRAGSCLAASCKRGNHELICIAAGCPSYKDRDKAVMLLFKWGFKRLK